MTCGAGASQERSDRAVGPTQPPGLSPSKECGPQYDFRGRLWFISPRGQTTQARLVHEPSAPVWHLLLRGSPACQDLPDRTRVRRCRRSAGEMKKQYYQLIGLFAVFLIGWALLVIYVLPWLVRVFDHREAVPY
jgi:hypothetical protein